MIHCIMKKAQGQAMMKMIAIFYTIGPVIFAQVTAGPSAILGGGSTCLHVLPMFVWVSYHTTKIY